MNQGCRVRVYAARARRVVAQQKADFQGLMAIATTNVSGAKPRASADLRKLAGKS